MQFLGRWRQTNQVEVDATDERDGIGIGNGLELVALKCGEQVAIDRRAWPDFVVYLGRWYVARWNKRPELTPFLDVDLVPDRGSGSFARVGRAELDPLLKVSDHVGRELFARRHRRRIVGILQGFDQ